MISYKQIGQGVFGCPQSSQYGIIISSISVDFQASIENIRNEHNITKSQYLNDDNAKINIEAFIVGATLPKVGDTIRLSSLDISMLTYSGGTVSSGVITNVTLKKNNTDFNTISIEAIHYPDVSY